MQNPSERERFQNAAKDFIRSVVRKNSESPIDGSSSDGSNVTFNSGSIETSSRNLEDSIPEAQVSNPKASKKEKKASICRRWRDKKETIHHIENGQLPSLEEEMCLYSLSSVESTGDSTDPLLFYKLNNTKYPILSSVAKRLLCVPSTSVPAESLFSKAGRIQTNLRNRIKPQLLEYFCFLNHNQI